MLPQHQLVDCQLAAHQLRFHAGLQQLQVFKAVGHDLHIDRAVQQRLMLTIQRAYQRGHVLQIALRRNDPAQVVGVGPLQLIAVGGVVNDTVFLSRRHETADDPQRYAAPVAQAAQQRL